MGEVTVVDSYIVALVMDVDRIPLEKETVVARNYHTTHGGKGSNMAACRRRNTDAQQVRRRRRQVALLGARAASRVAYCHRLAMSENDGVMLGVRS